MCFYRVFLLLSLTLVCLPGTVVCSQDDSTPLLETATGPDGLLQMEEQGRVTVRALRGWGRLPDKYMGLAQRMRQEAGIDLLGADLEQINLWGVQEDALMVQYRTDLIELAGYMERGEHLQWAPAGEGTSVSAGTLVRSGGMRWTQVADGPATIPAASVQAGPVQTEPSPSGQNQADTLQTETASAEPAPSDGTDTAASLPPTAPRDSGPGDGVEFPINDQVPGTYRVKLHVEGLTTDGALDDPYFKRRLKHLLPDSPAVLEGEKGYFNKLSSYQSVKPMLGDGVPYNLVIGFATPDVPVLIRVDAPENPEILLTEQEIEIGVSYRVVGKSVFVYQHDKASGDAEIEFSESHDGEVRWTPRIDSASGRPVGPRILGVYMSYRVKKYIRGDELGTLMTSQHRIGWVLVAMPGDVYEHEGTLYVVGQENSLLTRGSADLPPAPEKFDFELPQYALDKQAIGLSEDLRHVAWVEGERKGKKRVVVNGVPGKWYDDVKGYTLRFTPMGENFCFEAELGDKEIPVCNGADGPVFDDIELLEMSKNGAHVLVAGKVDRMYRVYLDGKLVRETPYRMWEGAVDWDGKAAWIERGQDELTGRKFAMVVTPEGVEGQKYPAVHGSLRFTQNRSELYYIAEKEGGNRFLVREAEELKPTMGYGYKFTVNPSGSHYAYVGHFDDGIRAMVINGQIGPDFTDIWDPAIFSAKDARHLYAAKKDKEAFLVVDGQVVVHGLGTVKSVLGETFSPDGRRWAAGFELNDNEYVILVDGKEIGRGQGRSRGIVFSPDGTRVAWLEKQKKSWRAYLDGQPGPEVREIYDQEPPQFSPDGRHLIYFSSDADKKMHITVFGGKDRIHDIIIPLAVFSKGCVEYLSVDGKRFRRESIPLK